MNRKHIAWILPCCMLIHFAIYEILVHCSFTAIFTQEEKNVQKVNITVDSARAKNTFGNALSEISRAAESQPRTPLSINVSPTRITAKTQQNPVTNNILLTEIIALLEHQLEINNTSPKYVVDFECQSNQSSKDACVRSNCSQLSSDPSERVKSLFTDNTVLTPTQDDLLRYVAEEIPISDVILVTAVSSNHFDEMQGLLHNLHLVVFQELAKRENFSLVLWDLGLSHKERIQVEQCCRCQVVTFPFDEFTSRTRDLDCYMWKPIIIRMTLMRARKYAVWQDSSIRYSKFPDRILHNGMQYGIQLLREKSGVSIPHRALPETFSYLGQEICNFYPYPEIAAGFGVYRNDPFVLNAVTNIWARCAFEEDCMCPRNTDKSILCFYGPCHRFDQSALSIITASLYSSEIYRILLFDAEKSVWVDRDQKEKNYLSRPGCLSDKELF